jgi:hypothetical protein
MFDKFRSFVEFQHRFGNRGTMIRVIDGLADRLLGVKTSRVMWQEAIRAEAPSVNGNLQLRALTSDDVRRWSGKPEYDLERELADRLNNPRHSCFAAFDLQRLVAYSWFSLGSIEPEHSLGVGMSLPADVAYTYKAFTHAEYRGRRIQSAVNALARRELGHRGIRQFLAFVDSGNCPSLRSCSHSGFVHLGWLAALSLGAWSWNWCPRSAEARGIVFTHKGLIRNRNKAYSGRPARPGKRLQRAGDT